jgi:nitrate/TMAO reductase-like tetraheme cytochrome c subunit
MALSCMTGFLGTFPVTAGTAGKVVPGVFNSSELCGECHKEIYAMWQRSMHSSSASDPIFETSYMQAYKETAGKAREICLRCHAPVAAYTGDLEMREPLSMEGITCDYCHSIDAVDLTHRDNPIRIALDGAKRGPLHNAKSPAHEVARSAVHETSEFCGACHEYVNPFGLNVLSTYSEWKASPQAAAGKTCHHCHMPMTPGETVAADLAPSRGSINLHNISGGHSTDQVRKAATVRILRVSRTPENLAQIEVEVANVGSGHSIPTGMPTRKLILEVVLYCDGHELKRFEREYQKKILGGDGLLIDMDHQTILDGRSIMMDNRLRSGEKRIERFEATILPKGALRAEATLRYLYQPRILMPQTMSIDMATDHSN